MAADEIQITLSADDAKAVRAWQRQRDNLEAFEKGLDGVGKKQKKVADEADDFGLKAMGSLGKMATTVIGIGTTLQAFSTAASLVAAEINNAVDRQKDAAQANLSLPAVQRQLFANIGAESKELGATARDRNAGALKMANQLADVAGVDLKTATEALSNAFSARQGSDTTQTAYQAALAGLQASPEDTETAKTLGAAALRLRAGNEKISSQQAIGYLTEAGALLPIEKTKDVATSLPRVVSAAKAMGGDEKFAASLFGAATTSGVDITGDPGATFVTTFLDKLGKSGTGKSTPMEQIQALLPKGQAFAKDRAEFERLEMSATRSETETRRLHELQTKHAGFLEATTGGEARFKPFVRSLLSGGDAFSQLTQNMGKAKSFAEAGAGFEEGVVAGDVSPQIRLAKDERLLSRAVEKEKLANVGGAFASVHRDKAKELAKASGDPAFVQMVDSMFGDFEAWGDNRSEQEVRTESTRRLRERAEGLLTPEYMNVAEPSFWDVITGAQNKPVYDEANTAKAERLLKVLEKLDGKLDDGIKAKVKVAKDNRYAPEKRAAEQQSGGGV